MPLFDYTCSSCKHKFDKFLSIANRDTPLNEVCPICNELEVTRDIAGVGLVQWDLNIRPDDTFTDLLRQIKKNNPKSTIDDKFRS